MDYRAKATYNSDLYFHEIVTLSNELPSFFKQYTNISFTEILKKIFINQLINRICPLCKNGGEDEYHFIILCSNLNNIKNKMFANILSIFPSFHVLTDEKKFLYLFQCEEYDIVEIEEVVHFKYDLNINQNITYNSDLYFHETVTLCNELPSFFKQYTNISFTEIFLPIFLVFFHLFMY
jgi:hypothetical protein